ncbi:MAG: YqaJ viral recombinase family protein [Simkaniaceae bacterium]|nr:YqaJ viral recombinase family protein [Simkaniaceae bacterium]
MSTLHPAPKKSKEPSFPDIKEIPQSFAIHDFEQGSDKWYGWRQEGIGASDVPILMGINNYNTVARLWDDKKGENVKRLDTPATSYGKEMEPLVREYYNRERADEKIEPVVPLCVSSKDNPLFKASLDGFCPYDRKLIEIKCPVRESVRSRFASGVIPSSWVYQLQWQLYVTGVEKGSLLCLVNDVVEGEDPEVIERAIESDKAIQGTLVTKAKEFLLSLKKEENPWREERELPLVLEDDYMADLVSSYREIRREEALLLQRKKDLRAMMEELPADTVYSYGMRIVKRKTSGSRGIDTYKMRQDGIDPAKYTKKTEQKVYVHVTDSGDRIPYSWKDFS